MRKRSRPVLHLPRTPFETLLEALTVLGIITILAMTVWGWLTLPAIIPTHYGISGAPNAYNGVPTFFPPIFPAKASAHPGRGLNKAGTLLLAAKKAIFSAIFAKK